MTLYSLLGAEPHADADQLWRAYQRARAALPRQGWPRWRAWLQGRSQASLDQAFQVLRDPLRRADYDRQLELNLYVYLLPPGH
jgi:hypothetical protein